MLNASTAWVPAESILDVNGPAFIYQNLASSSASEGETIPYAIQFNPTLLSITPTSVLPPSLAEQASFLPDTEGLESGAAIAGVETTPTNVHQVWIANRVAGSETWTFKSAEGKFLGATDRHGSVNALSEARGPLECWSLVHVPSKGGIAIKAAQEGGGYLTLDEVAGGKVILRADGESAEECVWQVRLQWKYRHQARKEHGGEELTASGLKKTFDPSAALNVDVEKLQ
jgi:protein FRG1